jgi:ABC-type antimicrobial peptide transport system permease subunit
MSIKKGARRLNKRGRCPSHRMLRLCIYGLVSYSVSRRTREFGIRMAIGAGRATVLRMVFVQGGLLCTTGIVAGIIIT